MFLPHSKFDAQMMDRRSALTGVNGRITAHPLVPDKGRCRVPSIAVHTTGVAHLALTWAQATVDTFFVVVPLVLDGNVGTVCHVFDQHLITPPATPTSSSIG